MVDDYLTYLRVFAFVNVPSLHNWQAVKAQEKMKGKSVREKPRDPHRDEPDQACYLLQWDPHRKVNCALWRETAKPFSAEAKRQIKRVELLCAVISLFFPQITLLSPSSRARVTVSPVTTWRLTLSRYRRRTVHILCFALSGHFCCHFSAHFRIATKCSHIRMRSREFNEVVLIQNWKCLWSNALGWAN